MASIIYLCLVYENFRRYKDYNKFYEISLTTNQVVIKEKYMDKNDYKLEFYEVPTEYADKVYKYVADKFIMSSFPFNVRSGELQSATEEFIKKCVAIKQEKEKLAPLPPLPSPSPLLLLPPPVTTFSTLALLTNKISEELTVVCSVEGLPPQEFFQQVAQYSFLQVLQHASLPSPQVDAALNAFHQDFQHFKTLSNELGLSWYKVSEVSVLQWWQKREPVCPSTFSPSVSPIITEANDEDILLDDIIIADNIPSTIFKSYNKKRKK